MNKLIEALEAATNVKTCCYNADTKKWVITYKNDLPPDELESDILIDFLENG